jgi:hypothetical protein
MSVKDSGVYKDAELLAQSVVATGGSTTTFVLTAAGWTPGAFAGCLMIVESGAGVGQAAAIVTNDATTLYFCSTASSAVISGVPYEASALGVALAAGSVVSIYRPMVLDGLHASTHARRLKTDALKVTLASVPLPA